MENDTIEIRIVEESVKVSELNDREKIIHAHGYRQGFEKGMKAWPGIISAIVMLCVLFLCLWQC